ncbi:hypothetical protein HID58_042755, partial [Brassica napus]
RGIERPGFRAEQEVIHPSFGTEDEGLGNEKFRGYVPICDQLLDPKNQVQGLSDQLSLALSKIIVEGITKRVLPLELKASRKVPIMIRHYIAPTFGLTLSLNSKVFGRCFPWMSGEHGEILSKSIESLIR